MFGPFLFALAALQSADADTPPTPEPDWHLIDAGASSGAIRELYVETRSMRTIGATKFVWILATLDTTESPYRYKKELMAIDCAQSRYEGVQWVWADAKGAITHSEDGDANWNPVTEGSPAESIMRFACAQP